jgi:hypothetical protein
VKTHGNRSYYISHTETLTSMLIFMWFEFMWIVHILESYVF